MGIGYALLTVGLMHHRKIMKKLILLILLLPSLCLGGSIQDAHKKAIARMNAVADYCDSLSWTPIASSPEFTLDFDHTTAGETSCGTNDEVGTLSSATIGDAAVANPGSDGNVLIVAGANNTITFDNSGTYFASTSGEIVVTFALKADNIDADQYLIYITGVADEDRLSLRLNSDENLVVAWEDNNTHSASVPTVDLSSYIGDWVQIHVRWDVTKGSDEFCVNWRIDANGDGDYSDGGVETWDGWTCDTDDLSAWAVEPGENDIVIGSLANHDQDVEIDDIEIESSAVTGGGTDFTADANCQGAWLFAGNLTDSSGEGNTLTDGSGDGLTYVNDYPSGFTTGKSIHLDGTADYLTRTDGDLSANFPGKNGYNAEDFAYCVWAKKDDNSGGSEELSYKGSPEEIFFGFSGSWGVLRWVLSDGGPITWNDIYTSTDNTSWTHYCFSFDGDGTDGVGTVWASQSVFGDVVNGTTNNYAGMRYLLGNASAFCIGSNATPGNYFDGNIYQPIKFNKKLTAAEATAIFTTGITGAD